MRIAILSDIHGNLDALLAFRESYDELWVLGDLVNYGPEPGAVIDYVRVHASLVVRGNHDHAVGFKEDPHCSPRFRAMAQATQRLTESVLTSGQKHFLRSLPLHAAVERGGARFYLCHAVPSDPLFSYCHANAAQWLREVEGVRADFIFVGHTHLPALRTIGACTVVNPGSLGQPKTGSPQACYAVWEDGKVSLRSYGYPVDSAVAKLRALPLDAGLREELAAILQTGETPAAPHVKP
jgi:putative phosphoesterase